MLRTALSLVVLTAAFAVPDARASVADVDTSTTSALGHLHAATTKLAASDRAGAGAELTLAADDADGALAEIASAATRDELAKDAVRAERALRKFRDRIDKTQLPVGNSKFPSLKAAKAIAATSKLGLKALRALHRAPVAGFLVEEVKASSAGFHKANTNIVMRISAGTDAMTGGPCVAKPTIRIIESIVGEGAILPPDSAIASGGTIDADLLARDARGNYLLPVRFGANGGAGRVEVEACGVTRRWLLFNYGGSSYFPPKPKPEPPLPPSFEGTYTGTWEGELDYFGQTPTGYYDGDAAGSIAGGVVTVTEPFDGTGTLTLSGSTGLIEGTGVSFIGDPVVFSGTVRIGSNGRAVVTGSYQTTNESYIGTGTFRLTR